jgi:hypothetical protein
LYCNFTVNEVCDRLDMIVENTNNINTTVNNIWNLLGNFSGGCFWVAQYSPLSLCYITDSQDSFKTYLEMNGCGSKIGLPGDNGTNIVTSCNYCSEDIQQFTTDCIADEQTLYYVDMNYDDCCAITGLVSDCGIDYSGYENQTLECSNQIECHYNTKPFLKTKIPFSNRDYIDFYCIVNMSSNYSCISEVYSGGKLLQTNPDVQNVDMYGVVGSFQGTSPIIRGWYRKGTLLPENTFTVKMRCSD